MQKALRALVGVCVLLSVLTLFFLLREDPRKPRVTDRGAQVELAPIEARRSTWPREALDELRARPESSAISPRSKKSAEEELPLHPDPVPKNTGDREFQYSEVGR